ncbi:MAG: YfcC family protein [Erysipelotrichaceae bacterium]|nr:YfcC family protein [Erysipelotrichaceae bacterium]
MSENKTKKKIVAPDTFVVIFFLIAFVCLLTYLIPAGKYSLLDNGSYDPNSFTIIESNPATLGDFVNAFMAGMTSSASTIFVCLFIGGAFGILQDTGAIHSTLAAVLKKTKGNYKLIIPAFMIVISILGAFGVGNNVALAFVPIMIILATEMKLDAVVVAAVLYISSNTGFTASPMNPFTVLLSQEIVGIPQMSGWEVRAVIFVLYTVLGILFTLRYCDKIVKNPSASITGILKNKDENSEGLEKYGNLTTTHILSIIIMFIVFVVYAYGGIALGWGISQLGSCMIVMGVLVGIIARMSPNAISKSFAKGAKTMLTSALVIGFASGIAVILKNAAIIHTIVYYLTLPLVNLPKFLSAAGMFFVNLLCNFPISSGSGKAAVVMPIMAPAADVLGITRQIAVLAYSFGDGICNFISPTNGLMVGTVTMSGLGLGQWFKFIWKYVAILIIISVVILAVLTGIGWA